MKRDKDTRIHSPRTTRDVFDEDRSVTFYLIHAESFDARRTLTVVRGDLTIAPGETGRALTSIIPDLIETRAVVQTGIRETFIGSFLTRQTNVIVQTNTAKGIHQRDAQTIV